MIPSPQELATLAIRRREELTERLEELQGKSGTSLLPALLRRCVITTVLCHQVLGALDRAASQTTREVSRKMRDSVEPEAVHPSEVRFARLWHFHLSLAVNHALVAYGEILRSADWRIRRQAMDSLLEALACLQVIGGPTDQPEALEPIIEGAVRIRALLEARRPEMGIAGSLFRDQEALNVEGTAWCYCAALIAETLRTRANGAGSAKSAVRAVDALRGDLEKAITFGPPPPSPVVVEPRREPQEVVKSQA